MKIHRITWLFILHWSGLVSSAQPVFLETNSRVIVEMESVAHNGWTSGTALMGSFPITCLYGTSAYLNTPGSNLLSYKIKISTPGTYRFVWHCKVGRGTSKTDHNDNWLRIPDAAAFYAKKGSSVVRPRGICTNDCPNGTGSNGWLKVYSNSTINWTWNTWTSANDPHGIYARFDTAGIYTVELSLRSDYPFLNRFVMFNESKHSLAQATNISLAPSAAEDEGVLLGDKIPANLTNNNKTFLCQKDPDSRIYYLNNTSGWEVYSMLGVKILAGHGETIDLGKIKNGIYLVLVKNEVHKLILR
jgi:hypothetical protein